MILPSRKDPGGDLAEPLIPKHNINAKEPGGQHVVSYREEDSLATKIKLDEDNLRRHRSNMESNNKKIEINQKPKVKRKSEISNNASLTTNQVIFTTLQFCGVNASYYILLMLPENINYLFANRVASERFREDLTVVVGGLALGNALLNVVGCAVAIGLNQGIDSFVSISYGAQEYSIMYVYLGRAQLAVICYCPFLVFVLWYAYEILFFLVQDDELAAGGCTYARSQGVGVFALFLADSVRKFMSNVGELQGIQVCQIFFVCCHPAWCVFFLWLYWDENAQDVRWIQEAVGLANSMTWSLFLISFTAVFLRWSLKLEEKHHFVVGGDENKRNMFRFFTLLRGKTNVWSFAGLKSYLSFAFPSLGACWTEWAVREILTVMASTLGPLSASVQGVVNIMYLSVYMLAQGTAAAAANLVGMRLGAQDPDGATLHARVCVGFMTSTWLILVFLCIFFDFGGFLAQLYFPTQNNDSRTPIEIITALFDPSYRNSGAHRLCASCFDVVFFLCYYPDGMENILTGILRPCGQQKTGAKVYFIQHYVFGLWFCYFVGVWYFQSVFWIWVCLAIDFMLGCSYIAYIYLTRLDFNKEATNAQSRISKNVHNVVSPKVPAVEDPINAENLVPECCAPEDKIWYYKDAGLLMGSSSDTTVEFSNNVNEQAVSCSIEENLDTRSTTAPPYY